MGNRSQQFFTLSSEIYDTVILLNDCYTILHKLVGEFGGTTTRLPSAIVRIVVTAVICVVTQRCLETGVA